MRVTAGGSATTRPGPRRIGGRTGGWRRGPAALAWLRGTGQDWPGMQKISNPKVAAMCGLKLVENALFKDTATFYCWLLF